ncbi:hypothetical protein PAL_GLEAN10010106 [Pteropus alecto]|uniref:Uncharacterized protein n=1 Tax=Pteropus alecto TaxID=9402 RepID=L5JZ04_PTEAL|nr:hypothetical protein PAL_GLEAN10010106 [Pteropus alecto]
METLAATGISAVCLLPNEPKRPPESVSSPTGPGTPVAVHNPTPTDTPAVSFSLDKPEIPPGRIFPSMGPGILAVVGITLPVGPLESADPCTVSLSPHKPETPLEPVSFCTSLGTLGATGTPQTVDTPAVTGTPEVCLFPDKCEKLPEAVSTPRGPGTLGATGISAATGTLALCLLPQDLGTPPGPVSSPNPGTSGATETLSVTETPIACLFPHDPGKASEPASSLIDDNSSGATGIPAPVCFFSHRFKTSLELLSGHTGPDNHTAAGTLPDLGTPTVVGTPSRAHLCLGMPDASDIPTVSGKPIACLLLHRHETSP